MAPLAPKALAGGENAIWAHDGLYILRISCINSTIFGGGRVIELWL